MSECEVCGSEQFYESAGFFYCHECHAQSQAIQKTVNETDYNSQALFSRAKGLKINTVQREFDDGKGPGISKPGTSSSTGEPESAFVLADIVFRAQVEWLIQHAGAREDLRAVTRSLWFSYLAVALPDVEDGVAGVMLQTDIWKKFLRKSDISALCNCKCKATELNRVFEHWKASFDESHRENETMEQSKFRKRKRGRPSRQSSDVTTETDYSVGQDVRLTIDTIIGILAIGLHCCQETILISDLLRWIRLLLLPCGDPSSVIADDQMTTFYLLCGTPKHCSFEITYAGIEWEIRRLMSSMKLSAEHLPGFSVIPVVERFISELNLPFDFIPVVIEVLDGINSLNYRLDLTATKLHEPIRRPQNLESLVMAATVCAMRMLFGLDGVTENKITTLLYKIKEEVTDQKEPFDFREWAHHIDRRRFLLFRHSALPMVHSAPAALSFIRENVVRERRKLAWSRLKKNVYQDDNYVDLQRTLQNAEVKHCSDDTYVSLSPTLRPFRAYTEALCDSYTELEVDFRDFSIDYLLPNTDLPNSGDAQKDGKVADFCKQIRTAQQKAYDKCFPVRSYNIREEAVLLPNLQLVPSESLRWLITVCAEMIEHRTDSLLGQVMFIEMALFPDNIVCFPQVKVLSKISQMRRS